MPAAIANREQILATILDRVAQGEYVHNICAEDGMPHPVTVQRWIAADEEVAAQWARARAMSALVEERRVAEHIDAMLAGELEPDVARVAINARQWLAKIRDPKSYGDKVELEHKGRVEIVPVLNITIAGPPPRIIEGEVGDGE